MTKKQITAVANAHLYLGNRTIQEAIDRLHEEAEEYGYDARVDIGVENVGYYSNEYSCYQHITIVRDENDEEYAKRIKQEAEYSAAREARDAAEFERLKEKFDKK